MKIRSLIFDIFLAFWSTFYTAIYFIFLPVIFLLHILLKFTINKNLNLVRFLADKGAKLWSIIAIFALKIICNITYEIRGLENIPKEQGFIIASKHQSAWETIIMHLIFRHPAYGFKTELLKIPFYGWYLNFMSGVKINRSGGSKSLKQLIKEAKYFLANKQNIIIFPQGTRTDINDDIQSKPYNSGIVALYNFLDIPILPVALNSGLYWNKKSKKSGKIIIEFLPLIKTGLNKKDFLEKLQKSIETKTNQLINE